MPMSSKIGRFGGYDHLVAEPRLNFVVATGATVRLDGLVGLHMANLNCFVVAEIHQCGRRYANNAQTTSADATKMAAPKNT